MYLNYARKIRPCVLKRTDILVTLSNQTILFKIYWELYYLFLHGDEKFEFDFPETKMYWCILKEWNNNNKTTVCKTVKLLIIIYVFIVFFYQRNLSFKNIFFEKKSSLSEYQSDHCWESNLTPPSSLITRPDIHMCVDVNTSYSKDINMYSYKLKTRKT